MRPVGTPVVYRVAEHQHATTLKRAGEPELQGSVYHSEMTEFAGLVGRAHPDGKTCDVVIFPPNRAPVWINGVKEGDESGCFREPGAWS